MELLGNPSAKELMQIIAVAGLAQNFAAVRSLVTSGIQKGHMKMHLLNILNQLNANDSQKEKAIEHFKTTAVSYSAVENFFAKGVMKEFFSQGKVLLTAEYAVLEGVKALALPTIKGQSLTVKTIESQSIVWKAFTHDDQLWIDAAFDFQFRCIYAGETSPKVIEKLALILQALETLSPSFYKRGVEITTRLDFPQDWGLGSSSTLVNNLAQWLKINPYILLDKTFGGSGYDLAAAQSKRALFYTRNAFSPTIEKVSFDPPFKDNLYFVYLNQKRNSQRSNQGLC